MILNTSLLEVDWFFFHQQSVVQLHDICTGKMIKKFDIEIGTVDNISGDKKYKDMFFSFESFLTPGRIHYCDLSNSSFDLKVRTSTNAWYITTTFICIYFIDTGPRIRHANSGRIARFSRVILFHPAEWSWLRCSLSVMIPCGINWNNSKESYSSLTPRPTAACLF